MSETPLRVVIADDDADIRALVTISVKRAGMDVVAAVGDGASALAVIRALTPDLAILDVAMPGLSGLEVCRMVRANPDLEAVRIVVLSAAVDEESRRAGMDAGAVDYVIKPFSPRALGATLAELGGHTR